MCKLFSFAIILVAFNGAFAYGDEAPRASKHVPLRDFTNVVNSFKDNAILAEHKCVVETWTTKHGCMYVTFETKMVGLDTPQKLCNDMYGYINQNDWMQDVTAGCEAKCNKLTLILKGRDNPDYDPNAVEAPKKPLEALGSILRDGFANDAQLGDYICDCNVYQNDYGCWNIEIDIQIEDDYTSEEEMCDNVVAYLDKPGILDGSTRTCKFIDGCTDKVRLHLIG